VAEAGGVTDELTGEPPGLIAASGRELLEALAALVGPP
jgi:hypothetical protein